LLQNGTKQTEKEVAKAF